MRRRHRLAAIVALLVAAAPLGPAAAAHAAPPGPEIWPYPLISCVETAWTHHSVYQDDTGRVSISVGGTMRPCPGVEDPGAGRSFTLYYGNTGYASQYVWPIFDPESQDFVFGASGRRPAPPDAICVITALFRKGPNVAFPLRRACVGIDRTDTGLVVHPIPLDDPRTTPLVNTPGRPPNPFCSGCL
jgi:hypothetical protein